MVAFVVLLLPETKGHDLEHTFRAFQHHWFWSRHSDIGQVHIEEFPLKGRIEHASAAVVRGHEHDPDAEPDAGARRQ